MEEVWKKVNDFGGIYEVSSYGNIRSIDREVPHFRGGIVKRKGVLLKQNKSGHYLSVSLTADRITKSVHRLVAIAFIPNPDNLPEVNHIDCNKKNNRLENLEWVTKKGNAEHAVKNGLLPCHKGANNNMAVINDDIARQIKKLILEGHRNADIGRMVGVDRSIVGHIKRGSTWNHIKVI